MKNIERIREMPEAKFAALMRSYGFCSFRRYIDLDAWLESEDPDWYVEGEPASVRFSDGKKYAGKIVGETSDL